VKIARLMTKTGPRWAVSVGDDYFAHDGDPFRDASGAGAVIDATDARLLVPCQPTKIICVARNYAAHAAELGNEVPAAPLLFLKPPSALIAHGEAIVLPDVGRVDYEGELAVVIARRCKAVLPKDALSVVFGYTCLNDVSARALQRAKGHFSEAKGFDTFCPVGPHIETELDPRDVAIRTTLDGEVVQDGRTSLMVHDIPSLIAHASSIYTLEPGDLIATGTPAGVGPMSAGSTVAVTVEGVGTLSNPVQASTR